MKVSLITPTAERPQFLEGLWALIQRQTYTDWEWLVHDSSLNPQHFDDPRVLYIHDEAILSIGEKRNLLLEEASGDLILHFDDDDYYAPHYAAFMVEKLRSCDFFTTHSWFSYDLKSNQTYYWATDEITQTQFYFNALSGGRVRELDFGGDAHEKKRKLNERGRLGYGFSYGYTRQVAKSCCFQDRDFGEDRNYYEDVIQKGFSVAMEADREGKAVHVIHETNTSGEYPQYRIPHFIAQKYLPDFFSHMTRYDEN